MCSLGESATRIQCPRHALLGCARHTRVHRSGNAPTLSTGCAGDVSACPWNGHAGAMDDMGEWERARRLQSGDVVEVVGSLRRRFYRAGAATVSRYEVEASSISAVRGRTAAP